MCYDTRWLITSTLPSASISTSSATFISLIKTNIHRKLSKSKHKIHQM